MFGLNFFDGSLTIFRFFLHGIFLETLDDSLFGHKRGDFIFEIRLSGVSKRVHFLHTSLNRDKCTIYNCRRKAIVSP
jgi:hypothetical protein